MVCRPFRNSMLHGLGGAHWGEGPDHNIQHGPTPPPPDTELIEERERVAEDLPRLAIHEAPNRESSRLSLMVQKLTIDAAQPPKKRATSSSYRTQGVFNRISIRYSSSRLV
jgi:hypothetical protein